MYQDNVDAYLATWNGANLDGLDDYVDANVVRRAPKSFNQDANNLGELKQVISNVRTTFPDLKVTLDEIVYKDDRAFWRWTAEGTNTGPGDFSPTGKTSKIPGAAFAKFRDGKMIEELVYSDALDMMMQLGLMEPPASGG